MIEQNGGPGMPEDLDAALVPDDTSLEERYEREAKRLARKRLVRAATITPMVLVLCMVNAALLGTVFVQARAVSAPAVAADAAVPPVEGVARDGAVIASTAASVPGRVRSAAAAYRPRGDIRDIFCRPWQGETEEDWRARVSRGCTR
jgi:hypothetical protein